MIEIYKKNESETNEVVSKSILVLFGFVLLIGVFCWIGVFDVYDYMINGFIIAATMPLLLPTIVVRLLHVDKPFVKYILITCVVLVTGVAYVVFTFQTVIIFVIPSIIATFYLDLKVMRYSGIISIINIALAHMFTCFHLFQPWIEPFGGMKPIMLYGALPRILQYLVCITLLYLLCKRILEFFNGFYQVIQEEKKVPDVCNTKNPTELDYILDKLTEREREVFELLVQGFTNTQIANKLYLSNGTIKNYVSVIYDKVGTRDRTALVLKYSLFYRGNDQSHT